MNLKKLYAETHRHHIFIAIWNLSCLFISAIGFAVQSEFSHTVAGYVGRVGFLANVVAIIVAMVLIFRQLVSLVSKKTFQFDSMDYLGLFNGAFVIFFWFCFVNLLVVFNDLTL